MRKLIVAALLVTFGLSVTTSAVTLNRWDNQTTANMDAAIAIAQGATAPSVQKLVNSIKWTDQGIDYYVAMIQGCLVPPADGDYVFGCASDDDSNFYLSPNDDIAQAIKIADLTGWSGADDFASTSSHKSVPITLKAGQKYAFSYIMREGNGGDNGSVGWTGPDPIGATMKVIAGKYVDALPGTPDVNVALTAKGAAALVGQSATVSATASVTQTGPLPLSSFSMNILWYKGDVQVGEGASFTVAAVAEADEGTYTAKLGTVSADAYLDVTHGLMHRYTFNEDAVEDEMVIKDVVGGEAFDAFLYGNSGKGVFQDGKFFFGNTTQGSASPATGDYIDLANGMISSIGTQMTVETWWTQTSVTGQGNWQRIWDFGISDGGEDKSSGGGNSCQVYLASRDGSGNVIVEYRQPKALGAAARQIRSTPNRPIPVNVEVPMTVVWDEVAGLCKLYVNGVIVGRNLTNFKLSQMDDKNNWIGRSQWGDPLAQGAINELRIWDTALSAAEIARHAQVGAEDVSLAEVNTDPNFCPIKTIGDENGDCVLDFVDYAMMVERWMMDVTVLQ